MDTEFAQGNVASFPPIRRSGYEPGHKIIRSCERRRARSSSSEFDRSAPPGTIDCARPDIAMQRPSQKSLKQKSGGENLFSNGFDPTSPRIVRFSPAMDVLPFSGLHTSPDPLRLSNLQKITGAAARLHRE
jgi:hypothetical protein